MSERENIKKYLFIALFAAFMAAGTFIRIPVGPVPITLTSFFMLLAGLLLGPAAASVSVIIYLIAGIIGLPAFAGGSGPAVFAGPTGGFLIGYLPTAAVSGLISLNSEKASLKKFPVADIIAVIAATVVLYAIGVPWLKWRLGMDWAGAFSAGMIPFLPGDCLKAVAAVLIRQILIRSADNLIPVRAH
ncbi:MAG: biotin transporter BioY [Spirochaetales bacterium]|nr:biotin transporter BioY [Spirochaetales bacterium]